MFLLVKSMDVVLVGNNKIKFSYLFMTLCLFHQAISHPLVCSTLFIFVPLLNLLGIKTWHLFAMQEPGSSRVKNP